MATLVVTGAAGFIGSHTTDALLQAGHRVVGIDNFRTGLRENLASALRHPGFALFELDAARPGALSETLAGISADALIHLAALVSVAESVDNPSLNFELNLRLTHLVSEAVRHHRIPRLVFASSAAVYGDVEVLPLREDADKRPISPYGAAKLASEFLLLADASAYKFTVRCQRYFNVFGPRQRPDSPYSGVVSRFQRALRENRAPTILGDGEQTRDFISVHDIARANLLAALTPGLASGAANICTGRPTSVNRLAAILASRHPEASAPVHAPPRPADIRRSLGDPSRALRDLGFSAQETVEAGLAALP